MKLLLKRIALKPTYTIGWLYIDGQKVCDTIEDAVRDLNKNGQFDNGEKKVYAETAIPYGTYDISATDEAARTTAVAKLRTVINSAMKHMSPKHFVIHPSTGTILTTGSDFAARKAQSRKSLRELQTHIASCNSTYGLSTILCVENCPRSVAYDAETTLALLSGEGLEQVRVCLDTGHALIPLNGSYINPTKNGDAVAILRKLGTRLGTLHIQQYVLEPLLKVTAVFGARHKAGHIQLSLIHI